MRQTIEQAIREYPTQTMQISWLETAVQRHLGAEFIARGGYVAFASVIEELCREKRLSPVRSSGSNGRTPPLFNRYRKQRVRLDESGQQQLLSLHPRIKVDRYLVSPAQYEKDQVYLLALDKFFKDRELSKTLSTPYAVNERSFQIFADEKFLTSSAGRTFLQQVGLTYADLGCYQTYEPFFYVDYRQPGEAAGQILVVENKDTFFTIKKCFATGRRRIDGTRFNFLIYGEGRKIVSSFAFITEVPGLLVERSRVYYFGDLDPEGIDIFGSLTARYPDWLVQPCGYLYRRLLELHGHRAPRRREKQQRLRPDYLDRFLQVFDAPTAGKISELLTEGRYLPQEGLPFPFFLEELEEVR